MSVKKNKKKKEKHIVGTKELIFDIVSVVLIICLGVYFGYRSTMAKEEPMAIPISNVSTPPKGNKFSRILTPAIAKMGTNKAAVAVWEIKLAIA